MDFKVINVNAGTRNNGQSTVLQLTAKVNSGHVVRASIVMDSYAKQSSAVAEVLTPALTWTKLVEIMPSEWHAALDVKFYDAETHFAHLTAGLINSASKILAAL
jgi:hypothetical protein